MDVFLRISFMNFHYLLLHNFRTKLSSLYFFSIAMQTNHRNIITTKRLMLSNVTISIFWIIIFSWRYWNLIVWHTVMVPWTRCLIAVFNSLSIFFYYFFFINERKFLYRYRIYFDHFLSFWQVLMMNFLPWKQQNFIYDYHF